MLLSSLGCDAGETDEQLARRIQEQYDGETAMYLLDHPHDPSLPYWGQRPPQVASTSASTNDGPSIAAPLSPLQEGATTHYPVISGGFNVASSSHPPPPAASSVPAASSSQASAAPSMGLLHYPSLAQPPQSAAAPPQSNEANAAAPTVPGAQAGDSPFGGASAPQLPPGGWTAPLPFEGGKTGQAGGKTEHDDAEQCVICLAAPQEAGFVHGDRCAASLQPIITEIRSDSYTGRDYGPLCPYCK